MTIQQAIEKSIEGGFRKEIGFLGIALESDLPDVFLDPSFWQSLGKAMGWKEEKYAIGTAGERGTYAEWIYRWHLLIDNLVEGKSIESFFETL